MSRKPKTPASIDLPMDILAVTAELGLRVVTYTTQLHQGPDSRQSIPRDCVAMDGKAGIFWRDVDRDYAIAGWEPWVDNTLGGTMFGGRYENYAAALSWMRAALKEIRAGRAKTF